MAPRTRARAAQAASASANQVFDTYELLENILLHLAIRDLLLSRRVSQQWQSLIKQSSRLQQALFLQAGPSLVCWQKQPKRHLTRVPDTSKTYAAMRPDDATVDFYSSGPQSGEDAWDNDDSEDEGDYGSVSYQDAKGTWYEGRRSKDTGLLKTDIMVGGTPNTLLFPDAFTYQYRTIHHACLGEWAVSQSLFVMKRNGQESATAWLKATGMTAKMFLTQPPATRVRWQFINDHGQFEGYGVMAKAGGIRVDDLLQALGRSVFAKDPAVKVCELAPVGILFPTADEFTMAQIPPVLGSSAGQDAGS